MTSRALFSATAVQTHRYNEYSIQFSQKKSFLMWTTRELTSQVIPKLFTLSWVEFWLLVEIFRNRNVSFQPCYDLFNAPSSYMYVAIQCFTSVAKRYVESTLLINFLEPVTTHSPISRGGFSLCKLDFDCLIQTLGKPDLLSQRCK